MFQPIQRILDKYGTPSYGDFFENRFGIASVSVIYYSVAGPLRATVNYFDSQSIINPAAPYFIPITIGTTPNQNLADIYPRHQTYSKHNCVCQKIFSLHLDCINLMKEKMSEGFSIL